MNKLLTLSLLAISAMSCKQAVHEQPLDTDDATHRGHEAAWAVAHADHTDTIALQRAIIDARSIHDQYVLTGDDKQAMEFEQAFADSLRHIDPQLASQIF